VDWENDTFPGCLGVPTHAYYWPFYIEGNNLGDLGADFAWQINGAECISLLSPNFHLYRTYN
jgi:hypothetical protein